MDELPKIQITIEETRDRKVDDYIQHETEVRRTVPPKGPREAPRVPFYYNPVFVYTLFGGVAAFLAWRVLESSMAAEELAQLHPQSQNEVHLAGLALFPLMGSMIGLFIAMSDGLLSRNLFRALRCGVAGLCIGAIAAAVGMFVGGMILRVMLVLVVETWHKPFASETDLTGVPFFMLMVGRTVCWTLVASGMGIGQGLALKSKKLVLNGLIGGLLGGFLGGICFDPIIKLVHMLNQSEMTAGVSRMVGLTIIGLAVGFFTGLVESMAKDAWLHMKAGPLAGKQFVIYTDPTVLGSSPKCDIYLFKDAAIEPRHAEIRALGTRQQIKDLSGQGVFVNGQKVDSRVLEPGDTIVLGATVLEYSERDRR